MSIIVVTKDSCCKFHHFGSHLASAVDCVDWILEAFCESFAKRVLVTTTVVLSSVTYPVGGIVAASRSFRFGR
jgi:hypothetical protein